MCKIAHSVKKNYTQSTFFHIPCGKFYTWLKTFTQPAVVMVVTNMRCEPFLIVWFLPFLLCLSHVCLHKACPNVCSLPECLATNLPECLTAWFPPLLAQCLLVDCFFAVCPNTWQQLFLNVILLDFPVYCLLPLCCPLVACPNAWFHPLLAKMPACCLPKWLRPRNNSVVLFSLPPPNLFKCCCINLLSTI